MRKYHPVFLDLRDRSVLIVGGGNVALEKIESLRATGAKITVLAPFLREPVAELVSTGELTWIEKRFDPSDVVPFFMIIAATDEPETNALVFKTGDELLRLTNSVDDPVNCNFIMAAITGHGPIQVAVSSAGCSPALAQRIRRQISAIVTPEVGELGAYLGDWRPRVKDALPTYKARQGYWERVLGSQIPALLQSDRQMADAAMEAGIVWGLNRPECLTCGVKEHGFVTVCADCPYHEQQAGAPS